MSQTPTSNLELRKLKEEYYALLVEKARRLPIWKPLPGPQTAALLSDADELFFGGSAGGGKTDLLLGMSGTKHWRAIVFRREFPRLRAVIERSREIFNNRGDTALKDSFNEQKHIWRLIDGRQIEFGSIQHVKDVENYRGRPHDLKAWDEVPEFPEAVFRQVNAWCRSTRPGQRCRIVATGNPPTTAEGRWVIKYWAPWLDTAHPRPALPGELRWYVSVDGLDTEVDGPSPVVRGGETLLPRSRTFIPSRLVDNPYLAKTGYLAILQGLPEPLRSQLLYGDFRAGIQDDAWQVIPTAWVEAAQKRWTPTPPAGQSLTCLGVDVAYGGADATVISPRRGPWFGPLKKYRGTATDSGQKAAFLVLKEHDGAAIIHVDTIGYGAACYEWLAEKVGKLAVAVNVAEATDWYDRSRKYRLTNTRTAMYWLLREALDPETGDNLALPPDPELLGDLTAPRFEVRASGIVVEAKEHLRERLGRSPDAGDAVALAHLRAQKRRLSVFA